MNNRGFVCQCGERMRVVRTVNPTVMRVVRYRKCAKCGHSMVTVESTRRSKLA